MPWDRVYSLRPAAQLNRAIDGGMEPTARSSMAGEPLPSRPGDLRRFCATLRTRERTVRKVIVSAAFALASALSCFATDLPDAILRFYADWNRIVSTASMREVQTVWADFQRKTDRAAAAAGYDTRLRSVAESLLRIAQQIVTPKWSTPIVGFRGVPVWAESLEVNSVDSIGTDGIALTIRGSPVQAATLVGGDHFTTTVTTGQAGVGGWMSEYVHVWSKVDGRWMVRPSVGVGVSLGRGHGSVD
jgi:hypothetical protein